MKVLALLTVLLAQDKPAPFEYAWGRAAHVLPETTSDESGYFSLCEGNDGRIYVGTAKYGENAYLVEFEPRTGKQRVVLDTNAVCGLTAKGYAAQAKLHTRNYVAPSGKIYVGSKQGYRKQGDVSEYPGGYVMVYDPATGKSENLGMPFPGQGVIDVIADEERGLAYVVSCEDQHWMLLDLKTRKYQSSARCSRPMRRRCSARKAGPAPSRRTSSSRSTIPRRIASRSATSGSTAKSGRGRTATPFPPGSSPRTAATPTSS